MDSEMEAQRRRLSLGFCCPVTDGEEKGATAITSPDTRGLLVQLKNTQIANIMPSGTGRRLSYSSVTDRTLTSFEDKKTVCEGETMTRETLTDMGVGIVCKKGLKPESPNQDSFSYTFVDKMFSLYGIYDGHGPSGHHVSNFCKDALPKLFVQHPKAMSEPEVALKESFITCQNMIELQNAEKTMDANMSGCTCSVVFRPAHDQFIVVAHVGDSRCVISHKEQNTVNVTDLTVDHKPNLPKEKERIESCGGRVVFDGFYNYRVFAKTGMYPGLNMSRALGDTLAHKVAGLTAEPDVERVMIDKAKDTAILLCTDGVWEFVESQESGEIVDKHQGKMQAAAENLAQESWDRWMNDSNGEISDDITAFVIAL